MEIPQLLSDAWKDVLDSGVPASIQEVAFREAVGIRSQIALSSARKPLLRPNSDSAKPASRTQMLDAIANSEGFDTDAAFSKLADETGIDEDELREVVLFTEDGQVDVLPPSRKLGSSVSERARNVAILVVGTRYAVFRERSVPIVKVRQACVDRGCYDSKNFKSAHIGKYDAMNIRNDDVLLNVSKWLHFFRSAVNTARGQSGGIE